MARKVEEGGGRWRKVEEGGGRWRKVEEGEEGGGGRWGKMGKEPHLVGFGLCH